MSHVHIISQTLSETETPSKPRSASSSSPLLINRALRFLSAMGYALPLAGEELKFVQESQPPLIAPLL
jgi:hypothetical protein